MNRKEERYAEANRYLKEHHSPSEKDNEFQNAMNIAVMKAHVAASEWADKTMIERACNIIKNLLKGYIIRYFHTGESYNENNIIDYFKKEMEK